MDGDSSYLTYLTQKLTQRLEEVNAEREAKGEGPLCEADGTPVTFVSEDEKNHISSISVGNDALSVILF